MRNNVVTCLSVPAMGRGLCVSSSKDTCVKWGVLWVVLAVCRLAEDTKLFGKASDACAPYIPT